MTDPLANMRQATRDLLEGRIVPSRVIEFIRNCSGRVFSVDEIEGFIGYSDGVWLRSYRLESSADHFDWV